jgi:hypothetical protein
MATQLRPHFSSRHFEVIGRWACLLALVVVRTTSCHNLSIVAVIIFAFGTY